MGTGNSATKIAIAAGGEIVVDDSVTINQDKFAAAQASEATAGKITFTGAGKLNVTDLTITGANAPVVIGSATIASTIEAQSLTLEGNGNGESKLGSGNFVVTNGLAASNATGIDVGANATVSLGKIDDVMTADGKVDYSVAVGGGDITGALTLQ